MKNHKFKVGERVYFQAARGMELLSRGLFKIVHLLPAENAENQYRIKSTVDNHERVAQESQLQAELAR